MCYPEPPQAVVVLPLKTLNTPFMPTYTLTHYVRAYIIYILYVTNIHNAPAPMLGPTATILGLTHPVICT